MSFSASNLNSTRCRKQQEKKFPNKEIANPIVEECTDDNDITVNIQQPTAKICVGFLTKFPIEVLEEYNLSYRNPYISLSNRIRRNRVNEMSQKILAANACKSTFKEKGMDYLVNNTSLASDVVIFLDAIKERIIQGVMQIKLNDVSNLAIPRPPEEEESMEEKAKNGMVIMRSTTQSGYTALMKIFIEKKKYDAESLSLCFKVFKQLRPTVDESKVQPEIIFISDSRSAVTRKLKSEALKGEDDDCRKTRSRHHTI